MSISHYHSRELARIHHAELLRDAAAHRLGAQARLSEGRRAHGQLLVARLPRVLRRSGGEPAVARPAH